MLRCARLPCNAIIPRNALPHRGIPSKTPISVSNPTSRGVSRSLSTQRSWVSSRTPQVPKRQYSGVITLPSPKTSLVTPRLIGEQHPLFIENNIGPNDNRPDKEVSTDTLLQNPGFRQFLGRTYAWTGLGLFGTLGVATLLAPLGMSMPLFIGGIVSSFASIFTLGWLKPEFKKKVENGKEILYAEDSFARRLSFVGLTGGMGVTT